MSTRSILQLEQMAKVSFDHLWVGQEYSREQLAEDWGYKSREAIDRGVVTPADHRVIILFVTREKQRSSTQYEDRLEGNRLYWEGPRQHGGERRIIEAERSGEEIHLFFRTRHHSDFTYFGQVSLEEAKISTNSRSYFVFRLAEA